MHNKKKKIKIVAISLGIVTILYYNINIVFSIAVNDGQYNIVNTMLNWGVGVNGLIVNRDTPLMEAVDHGQLEIVKLLLEHNANVNSTNKDGWSAIFFAADYGSVSITQALLDAGANVNVVDNDGLTPVIWAASKGYAQIVKQHIKHKANVNAKCTYSRLKGHTALSLATLENSYSTCKELIKAGANVNSMDTDGDLPINIASYKGNLKIMKLLIENGAYYEYGGDDSPLKIAKRLGYNDIVDYLISVKKAADLIIDDKKTSKTN